MKNKTNSNFATTTSTPTPEFETKIAFSRCNSAPNPLNKTKEFKSVRIQHSSAILFPGSVSADSLDMTVNCEEYHSRKTSLVQKAKLDSSPNATFRINNKGKRGSGHNIMLQKKPKESAIRRVCRNLSNQNRKSYIGSKYTGFEAFYRLEEEELRLHCIFDDQSFIIQCPFGMKTEELKDFMTKCCNEKKKDFKENSMMVSGISTVYGKNIQLFTGKLI
eukprot:Pgem_evm1s12881